MKLLVWHWGRHGAGPIFATRIAAALNAAFDTEAVLSLAAGAELPAPAFWPEPTYGNAAGYVLARLAAPFLHRRTQARLAAIAPDFAICAMPALLDRRMIRALRAAGIGYAVIVHDANPHPGDGFSFRFSRQPDLLRGAAILFTLSAHVEAALRRQGFGAGGQRIVKLFHPLIWFGAMRPAFSHGGRPRLLSFGRLLPYKGLDLLAEALALLGPDLPFDIRICGNGPDSPELARLAAMPGVVVDRRWIPETELPALVYWSDAVILPYREASQSGVAAAALGQGRQVVATRVGGLPEQLAEQPGAVLCEPEAAAIAKALAAIRPAALPCSAAAEQASWRGFSGRMLQALQG